MRYTTPPSAPSLITEVTDDARRRRANVMFHSLEDPAHPHAAPISHTEYLRQSPLLLTASDVHDETVDEADKRIV